MGIARRIEKIAPSATLEITSLAKKMRQQGEAVVNFAAGEPDFDTPENIKQAAIRAIKEGFTKYTPTSGWPELKQAICQKFARDNHLQYSSSQVIVTCGAKHALYELLQALCESGDEVVLASPYWVSYPEMINLSGATARLVQTSPENNFKLEKKALASQITPKTKVLIINSPSNPSGAVYSRRELEEITQLALERGLYIISDEIYEKLIYDSQEHISCASLNKEAKSRTIVVNGVSKSYAMTGWRIGYLACADEQVIQGVSKLQDHSTSNPCSISQKAAMEALNGTSPAEIKKMVQEFQLRRDRMLKGLSEISRLSCVKPQGAFYVFCNITQSGLDSAAFAQRLLQEAKVAAIPGRAFGRDDYVRFSFATDLKQIEEGVQRLKDWVARLS